MRKVYLITNGFPYGQGEKSFIIPEINYLKEYCDITILSLATLEEKSNRELTTELGDEIEVRCVSKEIKTVKKVMLFLEVHFKWALWLEYGRILRSKKHIKRNMYEALVFCCYGLYIYKQLKKMPLEFGKKSVFYSYWGSYQALSLVFLKKRYKDIKIITRMHGYDLYNERYPGNRQPFKQYMTQRFDRIFFVCKKAKEYFVKTFVSNMKETEKLYLARLGVALKQKRNSIEGSAIFELVSCSNVIPLKRIELIIEGLAICGDDVTIHWTRFGDGELLQGMKKLAEDKLASCKNISFTFCGYVSNQKIMTYYESHPVNCFITTSSSEGCPVSVQEAISYGIPVIGTAVGGMSELVEDNGILLSETPSPADVASAIKKIYYASDRQIQMWRDNSYKLWEDNYNADDNYKRFARQLIEL